MRATLVIRALSALPAGPAMLAAAVLTLAAPAPRASAATVNVDIDLPGDRTHGGSDGALSSGGTRWNAVVYDVDAAGLADEFGNATAMGVTYLRTPQGSPSPFLDFASMNDLQDTGMSGYGFEIRPLDPRGRYSLVIYAAGNATFDLLHAGGNAGGGCASAPPSYVLPGTDGRDYCRFDDLVPFEVAPGVYGLRLSALVGAVTGFQILGSVPEPEPTDTVPPECSGTLIGGTPASLSIVVRDTESGLASVAIPSAENADVVVGTFTAGTTEPVQITVTPIDPGVAARITVAASDVAGNGVACEYEIAATPPPPPPDPQGCASPGDCCEEVLGFYRTARADGMLRGSGPGRSADSRRRVLERMLERACLQMHQGAVEEACATLAGAYRRTDGSPIPVDFVSGPLAQDLALRIRELRADLGCTGGGAPAAGRLRPLSEGRDVAPATWGMIKSLYGSEE